MVLDRFEVIKMVLVFLYGYPGVGKLTVARELAKITNFKVFHNHLTVDLLLSIFDFGSPEFIRLRDKIWLDTMSEAARLNLPGLIFTFSPENTVPQDFIVRLEKQMTDLGAKIIFVKIFCQDHVIKDRIDSPSRQEFRKLRNFELFEREKKSGCYDYPKLPDSALTIDNSTLEASLVARKIKFALTDL